MIGSVSLSNRGFLATFVFAFLISRLSCSVRAETEYGVCCGEMAADTDYCGGPFSLEPDCSGCKERAQERGDDEVCLVFFCDTELDNCQTTPSPTETFLPSNVPSPRPTPSLCDDCGLELTSLDVAEVKDMLMNAGQALIENYSSGLDNITCSSMDCERAVSNQRMAIEDFNEGLTDSISRLDVLECIQNNTASVEPECVFPQDDTKDMFEFERMLQLSSYEKATRHAARRKLNQVADLTEETEETETLEDLILSIQINEGVVSIAEQIFNSVPECGGAFSGDTCSGVTSVAKIALAGAIAIAQATLAFQNANFDLKDQANGSIQLNYITANYDNIIIANDKLDLVLCPFGEDGLDAVFPGQGCDGIDQDCNCETDECKEDQLKPTISLKVSIPDTPFGSLPEAREFLEENIVVGDDCATDLDTTITDPDDENCMEKCTFTVRVEDMRCINEVPPLESAFNEMDFCLEVDSTPADITCGFYTPQDAWHVAQGVEFDPCEGIAPPYPEEGDILHIDPAFVDKDVIDVAFWYQVDNGEDAIDVTIELQSNELEDNRPTVQNTQAFLIKRSDKTDVVQRVDVYLAPFSCKNNGDKSFCIVDPAEGVSTRIYDIVLSAVDAAGNKSSKTCSVIVIPCGHYCSRQRKGGKGGKGSENGGHARHGRRGRHLLDNKKAFTGPRGTQQITPINDIEEDLSSHRKSKGESGKSKGGGTEECLGHADLEDFDDLRMEYDLSSQRYVIDSLVVQWDPELDTTPIEEPPLPEFELCQFDRVGKGKGSFKQRNKSFESCTGDRPSLCGDCPTPAPKGKGKGSKDSDSDDKLLLQDMLSQKGEP